jgi:hypothetical protein
MKRILFSIVCISLLFLVCGCDQSPEDREAEIAAFFGDTTNWGISEWQAQVDELNLKIAHRENDYKRFSQGYNPSAKNRRSFEIGIVLDGIRDEIRIYGYRVNYAKQRLLQAQSKTAEHTESSSDCNNTQSEIAAPVSQSKHVSVGAFTVDVPAYWKSFSAQESYEFKRQYTAQSEEIYRQYSGINDTTKSLDIAGFHISDDDGAFIIASFTVPPQSDLITLLKSQAADKAAWGVREGYIRKYLGLVSIDDEQFDGFYTKTVGKDGGIQVSAGLEHKKLKNTIVQLTLLCPKPWDEVKATDTLTTLLKSVTLKDK